MGRGEGKTAGYDVEATWKLMAAGREQYSTTIGRLMGAQEPGDSEEIGNLLVGAGVREKSSQCWGCCLK